MIAMATIGIGNYGSVHVEAAKRVADAGLARFAAVADVQLDRYPELVAELQARGVACYRTPDELLDRHPEVELVTLPLPIYLHAPMAIACLQRGKHVLVEKPPAPTLADAQAMAEAARRAGRHCGVSFQYSTNNFFVYLCQAIAAGRLGEITDVSVLNVAARGDGYYQRAGWAGKITFNGHIVRDGSLNNPCAHQAQMLLAFAGAARGKVARPLAVEAELFAGHDIETEDTAAVRATLDTGATLHFYAGLCCRMSGCSHLRVTGTRGVFNWHSQQSPQGEITWADGTTEPIPQIVEHGGTTEAMFRNYLDVLAGRAPRLACTIEDTLGFAELVEKVFTGAQVRHLAGTPCVHREDSGYPDNGYSGGMHTYLDGVDDALQQAFATGSLLSETAVAWAR